MDPHVNALTFKNIVWDHKIQNVFSNYYINVEGLFCGENSLYNLYFSLEVPQNQLKHPLKSLASLYFLEQLIKLNSLAKKKVFSHGAFQVHFQCDFQYHFQHPKNCCFLHLLLSFFLTLKLTSLRSDKDWNERDHILSHLIFWRIRNENPNSIF